MSSSGNRVGFARARAGGSRVGLRPGSAAGLFEAGGAAKASRAGTDRFYRQVPRVVSIITPARREEMMSQSVMPYACAVALLLATPGASFAQYDYGRPPPRVAPPPKDGPPPRVGPPPKVH